MSTADEWVAEMWYTHTMEHYLAIKGNEEMTNTGNVKYRVLLSQFKKI